MPACERAVIGAGLGVATALLLHVGTAALMAAVGVTMTIAYAIFAVNYLLFAVFLTDFVVLLMALLGETAEQTVAARLIGTAIGAAQALIGYLAWPSWEGESAQQKLARLFETQTHYAATVLRACARPGGVDAHAQRLSAGPAGRAARQARSDAEASAEPAGRRTVPAADGRAPRVRPDRDRPPGSARLAHPAGRGGGCARRPETPGRERIEGPAGAVSQFADGVETAGQVIAGSLRSLRPPGDMPPLRELQTAIYDQLSRPATTPGAASRNGWDLASQDPAYGLVTTNGQDPGTPGHDQGDPGQDRAAPGQDSGAPGQARAVSRARAAGRTQAAHPGAGRTTGPDSGHVTAADADHGTRADAGHTAGPGPAPDETDAVLLGATDEFTDALDTAADLLRRRLNGSSESRRGDPGLQGGEETPRHLPGNVGGIR